jgi:hypothetical protein
MQDFHKGQLQGKHILQVDEVVNMAAPAKERSVLLASFCSGLLVKIGRMVPLMQCCAGTKEKQRAGA